MVSIEGDSAVAVNCDSEQVDHQHHDEEKEEDHDEEKEEDHEEEEAQEVKGEIEECPTEVEDAVPSVQAEQVPEEECSGCCENFGIPDHEDAPKVVESVVLPSEDAQEVHEANVETPVVEAGEIAEEQCEKSCENFDTSSHEHSPKVEESVDLIEDPNEPSDVVRDTTEVSMDDHCVSMIDESAESNEATNVSVNDQGVPSVEVGVFNDEQCANSCENVIIPENACPANVEELVDSSAVDNEESVHDQGVPSVEAAVVNDEQFANSCENDDIPEQTCPAKEEELVDLSTVDNEESMHDQGAPLVSAIDNVDTNEVLDSPSNNDNEYKDEQFAAQITNEKQNEGNEEEHDAKPSDAAIIEVNNLFSVQIFKLIKYYFFNKCLKYVIKNHLQSSNKNLYNQLNYIFCILFVSMVQLF